MSKYRVPTGMIREGFYINCMSIKTVRKLADKNDLVVFNFNIYGNDDVIGVELTKREVESKKDSEIVGGIVREWLKLCEKHDRCLTFVDIIGVKLKK